MHFRNDPAQCGNAVESFNGGIRCICNRILGRQRAGLAAAGQRRHRVSKSRQQLFQPNRRQFRIQHSDDHAQSRQRRGGPRAARGSGPNIQFQNGGQPAIPGGLGGTTPGASFGYAVKTPMGTMFFGLTSSLGSDRSNVSQSGSITMMDGGTGFLSDTSQSPFVTSIVPVVGGGGNSVLGERLQRLNNGEGTAKDPGRIHHYQIRRRTQPRMPRRTIRNPPPLHRPTSGPRRSIAGLRQQTMRQASRSAASPDSAQQAAEDQAVNQEYRQKFEMAQAALAGGKPGVARLYYQQVVRHANRALRQQAIECAESAIAQKRAACRQRPPVAFRRPERLDE